MRALIGAVLLLLVVVGLVFGAALVAETPVELFEDQILVIEQCEGVPCPAGCSCLEAVDAEVDTCLDAISLAELDNSNSLILLDAIGKVRAARPYAMPGTDDLVAVARTGRFAGAPA